MSVKRLYVLMTAVAIGCASAGGPATAGGGRSVLTAQEIATFDAEGRTAYDMVSRLRPKWLLARGVQSLMGASDSTEFALVVVDGHPMGRVQALRDIEALQVADIRYLDVAETGGKYGSRGSSGAIEVRMKTSSRQ